MSHIVTKHISTGVTWVAIDEAGLYICCGCPADTVKHLKKRGVIQRVSVEGVPAENGPNAILLSDTLIQNGQVANLTEFPILQMLYLQGMNLPDHPNYKKLRPLLIGYKKQIDMQLNYVSLGNHGLSSVEEIVSTGISLENAEKIFRTKIHYSGGEIIPMQEMVDALILDEHRHEIRNGVFIERLGLNWFEISYKGEKAEVNLNVREDEHFSAPYDLPFRQITPGRFSVTHTGEGNGWDEHRPCMASVIHHDNRIYLIDAGPNILNNLAHLGIGLSEIDGIFLSHIHDDHFAGFTELLNVERKLNFYASRLVRHTAELKLKALMNSDQDLLQIAFNCVDLEFNEWNNVNGLEVMPIYSPHTVETSTFHFRANDGRDYKTYAHLSDTINLTEFQTIVENSPEIFTDKDMILVRDSYLSKVNLKKIDVGGGAIHGHLSDYEHDKSDLKVIAHTTQKIDLKDKSFVNVEFGQSHILIGEKENHYLRIKALLYLGRYFNMLEKDELETLSGQSIKLFKPGEHIVSREESSKFYLILSGLVSFENETGMIQTVDAGNFMGFSRRYFRDDLPEDYHAWSFVHCMEYDESFMNQFIQRQRLTDDMKSRLGMMRSLSKSVLINDLFSNAIINRLSKHAFRIKCRDYEFSHEHLSAHLFIITNGKVTVQFENGNAIRIGENEHFGAAVLMNNFRRRQQFIIDDNVEAICIPASIISAVPKMLWRLIELEDKRYQLSIFIVN
ncbi:MAG: MBL fold metallo-hydrolase [Cytophagales bacterium]|nr:MBL fold metallo-hydrolase [Cytophagales bacterium]